MCGILGVTGRREEDVRRAAAGFSYRGPDAFGIFADASLTLGHNRLSIIDPIARSNQPLFDEAGEIGIVHNGEIYNFREIRHELSSAGHAFRTQSDTEVLVAAYREWGRGMLSRVSGMFAFAIFDARDKTMFLATDHSNMKPLYYGQADGRFAFASTLGGTLALLNSAAQEIDPVALDLYWAFGYVPAPHTLYRGIRRLPAASWASFDLKTGALSTGRYHAVAASAPSADARSLDGILRSAVEDHLASDVPVGLFFSGGTDSSLIAAELAALGAKVEAFTLHIAGRDGDAPYAAAIAKRLGMRATVFDFGPREFDEAYAEVMDRLDDPIADNSLFPTYYLARKAGERVKVVLSGEGGDEYFSGYPRSLDLSRCPRADAPGLSFLERLYLVLPRFPGKNALFARLFLLARLPAAYYLLAMSPARGFLSARAWQQARQVIAEAGVTPARFDAALYLPDNLLRKTDLATMYASIEGRMPLLDPRVIRASEERVPESAPDLLKPRLKAALSLHLPRELVYRAKSGFGLDPARFLASSERARAELPDAIAWLFGRGLLPSSVPEPERLLARYPHFALQALALYHALRNGTPLSNTHHG